MKRIISVPKSNKIKCPKHGEVTYVSFLADDDKWQRKVCFKCWAEKSIKGLKLY